VYSEAAYDVGTVTRYFSSVNEAWRLVFFLAAYRALLADRHVTYIDWLDADQPMIAYDEQNLPDWLEQSMRRVPKRGSSDPSADLVWLTMFELPPLMFERIRLNSPLEVTLAAAGSTGLTIYALHLLRSVLSDPGRIGAWLPRLAAGWYEARQEALKARQEYEDELRQTKEIVDKKVDALMDLSEDLEKVQPDELTVTGATETPEDIAHQLDLLSPKAPQRETYDLPTNLSEVDDDLLPEPTDTDVEYQNMQKTLANVNPDDLGDEGDPPNYWAREHQRTQQDVDDPGEFKNPHVEGPGGPGF
jgi:hypothetical protein